VEPGTISHESHANEAFSGVIDFSKVQNVDLDAGGSTVTIDKNKFLLKGNTYSENYSGTNCAINYIKNLKRIHMDSETYIGN
jgi:hypothetical protein